MTTPVFHATSRKIVEIHMSEKERQVMLRIVDASTGEVESTVIFNAEEAAHHTRGMYQVCRKIKATGTHMILPGDVEFKFNG